MKPNKSKFECNVLDKTVRLSMCVCKSALDVVFGGDDQSNGRHMWSAIMVVVGICELSKALEVLVSLSTCPVCEL